MQERRWFLSFPFSKPPFPQRIQKDGFLIALWEIAVILQNTSNFYHSFKKKTAIFAACPFENNDFRTFLFSQATDCDPHGRVVWKVLHPWNYVNGAEIAQIYKIRRGPKNKLTIA